jgi:hypothetical protein
MICKQVENMKRAITYLGLIFLGLIILLGIMTTRKEFMTRSIQATGEVVNVTIDNVDCNAGIMTFHLRQGDVHEKEIDESICGLFEEGQVIFLKHNRNYPQQFVFVNEDNSSLFILGGVEIGIGLIGLLIFLNIAMIRRAANKALKPAADVLY